MMNRSSMKKAEVAALERRAEAMVKALKRIVGLSTSVAPNSIKDRRAIHQLAKETLITYGDLEGAWGDDPKP